MCVREETGIKGGGSMGGVRVCVSGERESMERRERGGCNVCVAMGCGVWCVVCGAGGADVRFDTCVCPYAPVRCTLLCSARLVRLCHPTSP